MSHAPALPMPKLSEQTSTEWRVGSGVDSSAMQPEAGRCRIKNNCGHDFRNGTQERLEALAEIHRQGDAGADADRGAGEPGRDDPRRRWTTRPRSLGPCRGAVPKVGLLAHDHRAGVWYRRLDYSPRPCKPRARPTARWRWEWTSL